MAASEVSFILGDLIVTFISAQDILKYLRAPLAYLLKRSRVKMVAIIISIGTISIKTTFYVTISKSIPEAE